ncbi:MAG: cellulase family glycosylhydrolase [Acidobacteriota bacterium]|nr:cellulase family glycosylhydrolase [Acidobacteriota bacterium]
MNLNHYLKIVLLVIVIIFAPSAICAASFVTVENHQFYLDGKPYYYIGTNYWYGTVLGLEKDRRKGIDRLRKELDFLKANGVTNLRLMAGAEGAGLINGITRVAPALQPEQGKFDETVLDGLDLILAEMNKRGMKAVIFLSNNWEWSGGFQQYLIWNNQVSGDQKTRKLTWDEQRDIVAQFYSCGKCKESYNQQVNLILNRKNKYDGLKYTEEPSVMAWELANEPRPMRPYAAKDYQKWISGVAALIKSKDANHLVTIGHEGYMGTEDIKLFEQIHADKNIGYLTIHIWAKNWGWFEGDKVAEGFPNVVKKATAYLDEHLKIAEKLNKPLVIEEFGLPRDQQSFDINAPTSLRDKYYDTIFSRLADSAKNDGYFAGAAFWAFGGTARPILNQIFWKKGDDYMGDPPMEEQGLNTVFDSDKSTWKVIDNYSKSLIKGKN